MRRRLILSIVLAAATLIAVGGMLACGGSSYKSPTEPGPSGQQVTIEVMDSSFSPKSVQINPGDTVVWVLRSSMFNHTVTDTGGAFDSGFAFKVPDANFQRTFGSDTAGRTFNYQCTTHAAIGMRGSVRVGGGAPPPNPGY